MIKIQEVHILKIGDSYDSEGNFLEYTLKDLQSIAESYDPDLHEAPIIWGHEDDRAIHRTLNSSTQLANGWVRRIYVAGSDLYCDVEVDEDTYKAMKAGKLKKRSVGLYTPDASINPKPGGFYLRHLALLGSEPPAIKGLKNITLYTEEANMTKYEAKKLLDAKSTEWLSFVLKDDGEGFGEDIERFEPQPSEENNWLYDSESESYKGRLIAKTGEAFDFEITKKGDGWESEVKPVAEEAEAEAEEQAEEAEAEEAEAEAEDMLQEEGEIKTCGEDEELMENGECMKRQSEEPSNEDKLKEELAKVREELAKVREEQKMKKHSELSEFIDSAYANGALLESKMPKAKLIHLIISICDADQNGMAMYSENDKEVSNVDILKELISGLPPVVEYSSSVAQRMINEPILTEKYKVPKSYGTVTQEDAKLYAEIMAYKEKEKCGSFAEARRKYLANKK